MAAGPITGLAALKLWDVLEPVCPLCAERRPTGAPQSPERTFVPLSRMLSPPPGSLQRRLLRHVSEQDVHGGDQPASGTSSAAHSFGNNGLGAQAAAAAARMRRSSFVSKRHQQRRQSPVSPRKAGGATPPPTRSSSQGTSVTSMPPSATDGAAPLTTPATVDFPLYVSHLYKGQSPQGSRRTTLGSMAGDPSSSVHIMADHVLYSNACRWTQASHAEYVARSFERNERRAAAAAVTPAARGPVQAPQSSNAAIAKMRSLVSQEKRRFQEDGFDLDLTYITRRIIAMGFPSHGRESYYRNPIGEVERFFAQRHGDGRYRIYNLCAERAYDDDRRFNGQHRCYPFQDHNPPAPMTLITDLVNDASAFLQQHRENVVAIHCKAGKGRTGLMICCLLRVLESNKVRSAEEALTFFGSVRTSDGHGVTIPSQHRYVHYWDFVLRHWQGVCPPRAPPSSDLAPTVYAGAAGDADTSGWQHSTMHLDAIVIDSPILVQNVPSFGSASTADSAAAQGTEIYFTLEENNVEVFDSRRDNLVAPNRQAPLANLQHHQSMLGPATDVAKAYTTYSNTRTTCRDFKISVPPSPPMHSGFNGYVFGFPTASQAADLQANALRSGQAPARGGKNPYYVSLAGDIRLTVYQRRSGLLQKDSELFHLWVNSFMCVAMTGVAPSGGGSVRAVAPELFAPKGQDAPKPEGRSPHASMSKAPLRRYVRLAKHEIDGPHKDSKHHEFCAGLAVTLYFSPDAPYSPGSAPAVVAPQAPAADVSSGLSTPSASVRHSAEVSLSSTARTTAPADDRNDDKTQKKGFLSKIFGK